jgi:hypothetical protein
MTTTIGLVLTALVLILVATWLQKRWGARGALPLEWFESELPKHEKQEKRASGLL